MGTIGQRVLMLLVRCCMATRTYETEALRVAWDTTLCIHTGICLKLGDGVFDSQRHPWVDLTLASTDTVVAAVTACPSGALTYERLDGEQGEQSAVPTTVVPWPNGPLLVRGAIEVSDRHGDIFTSAPRAALCRCGSSSNQPFCDLSHRDEGFKDYPRVHSQTRHSADSPADISPTELE